MAFIEGGSGSGGISSGIGGVALGGGPSLGVGPINGGIEVSASAGVNMLTTFGPKLDLPTATLDINEGPVGVGFLNNTEPYVLTPDPIDLTGGLRFHAPGSLFISEGKNLFIPEPGFGPSDGQAAVAEAGLIVSEAAKSPLDFASVLDEANQILGESDQIALNEVRAKVHAFKVIPIPEPDVLFNPQPVKKEEVLPIPTTKSLTEEAISPSLSIEVTNVSQTEARTASEQGLSIPAPQESQVVQKLDEQEVAIQDAIGDDSEILEEEEIKEVKTAHGVDKKAVRKRIGAIIEAAKRLKAKKESKGEQGPISGRELKEYISNPDDLTFRGGEFNEVDPEGNLPDGTWEANLTDLESTKFSSIEEVEKSIPDIIFRNNPFERGEGEEVKDETIATGYKHAPNRIHKARQIFLIRTKKRQILARKEGQSPVSIVQSQETKTEGNIQDHPELAESLLAKTA